MQLISKLISAEKEARVMGRDTRAGAAYQGGSSSGNGSYGGGQGGYSSGYGYNRPGYRSSSSSGQGWSQSGPVSAGVATGGRPGVGSSPWLGGDAGAAAGRPGDMRILPYTPPPLWQPLFPGSQSNIVTLPAVEGGNGGGQMAGDGSGETGGAGGS
jgi:hypothetical protein